MLFILAQNMRVCVCTYVCICFDLICFSKHLYYWNFCELYACFDKKNCIQMNDYL